MTKWHKLTGAYCSPLFIDLQNLSIGLVANINKKCNILVCNLFTNIAKVGDILFNLPTTATCNIEFPPVIVTDI